MEKESVLLTTTDNPFDPFEQFSEWLNYDVTNGYFTCQRLSRICQTSNMLTDGENQNYLNDAIDELIKLGAISNSGERTEYIKVYKN